MFATVIEARYRTVAIMAIMAVMEIMAITVDPSRHLDHIDHFRGNEMREGRGHVGGGRR
jgi:hypothetical protein